MEKYNDSYEYKISLFKGNQLMTTQIKDYQSLVCSYLKQEYKPYIYKQYSNLNKKESYRLISLLDEILVTCFLEKSSVPNTAGLIAENLKRFNKKNRPNDTK